MFTEVYDRLSNELACAVEESVSGKGLRNCLEHVAKQANESYAVHTLTYEQWLKLQHAICKAEEQADKLEGCDGW